MRDGTNLKQWYLTLVSSSLSVIAFGRDSEKLVQRRISSMGVTRDPCHTSSINCAECIHVYEGRSFWHAVHVYMCYDCMNYKKTSVRVSIGLILASMIAECSTVAGSALISLI